MDINKISKILKANRITKQKGIQSGYSLNAKDDVVELHYFAFQADLSNERLEQISSLLCAADFTTKIIKNEDGDIWKVEVTA